MSMPESSNFKKRMDHFIKEMDSYLKENSLNGEGFSQKALNHAHVTETLNEEQYNEFLDWALDIIESTPMKEK